MDKTIEIRCTGVRAVRLEDLQPFQGELKVLTDENYRRLKQEIVERGFSEPIAIWETLQSDRKYRILNGHQRYSCLIRMQAEGWEVPRIPVSLVVADTWLEAKRKVLGMASQYGTFSAEGVVAFAAEAELALDDVVERYRFPELEIGGASEKTASGEARALDTSEQDLGEGVFSVMVDFESETDASRFFDKMNNEGRICRLIVS